MVTQLYTDEEKEILKKQIKKYSVVCVATFAVTLILCIVCCLFVNDKNAIWLEAINIILCAVCGWLEFYWIVNIIFPSNDKRKYIEQLHSANKRTVSGEVVRVSLSVTLVKDRETLEIEVYTGKTNLILYWDGTKELPEFINKQVVFYTLQNNIVAYEVAV